MLRNSSTSEVLRDFAVVVLWNAMVFKLYKFIKKFLGTAQNPFWFTNKCKKMCSFPFPGFGNKLFYKAEYTTHGKVAIIRIGP